MYIYIYVYIYIAFSKKSWRVRGTLETHVFSGSKGGAEVGTLAGAGSQAFWGEDLLHDVWGLLGDSWGVFHMASNGAKVGLSRGSGQDPWELVGV